MAGFRKGFIKVVEFLKEEFPHGVQTFFSPNNVEDKMVNIYDDEEDGICIYYCPSYDYIEIFGLTEDEEDELECHTNYCSFPTHSNNLFEEVN